MQSGRFAEYVPAPDLVKLSNDTVETIAFTESLCKSVNINIIVSTSTPMATPTGTPLPQSTDSVASESQSHSASGAPLDKSTSTKPAAPATATVTPSSEPSALTGAAARRCARYVWAGTLLGVAVFPLF